MNIVFRCQFCQASMQTTADAIGLQCVCVSCGKTTTIQVEEVKKDDPLSKSATSSIKKPAANSQTLSIACPKCSHSLEYAKALIGTKGLCRNCHELFVLPPPGQSAVVLKRPKESIAFECPKCLQLFEGNRDQVGRKGKCTNCATVFPITAIEPTLLTESKDNVEKTTTLSLVETQANRPNSPKPSPPRTSEPRESTAGKSVSSTPSSSGLTNSKPKEKSVLKAEIIEEDLFAPSGKSNLSVGGSTSPGFGNLQSNSQLGAASLPALGPLNLNSGVGALGNSVSTWSSLDAGLPLGPADLGSPYSAPAYAPSLSQSSTMGLGKLLNRTMNCLFPAIFYMYLPFLCWAASLLATTLISMGFVRLLIAIEYDPKTTAPEINILLEILRIAIKLIGTYGTAFFFLPSMYVMAMKAARDKQVSSDDLAIPNFLRLNILGYVLLQNFVLLPLALIGYATLFFTFDHFVGESTTMTPAKILALIFFFFIVYVHMNILTVGIVAVADEQPIGDALVATFRAITKNFAVFFTILLVEFIPAVLISATVFGFGFFVLQYVTVRSAVFYRMSRG